MSAPDPSFLNLMQLAFSSHVVQSVRLVCKYKIADLIHSGKTTSKELAEATGLHEPTLYRIVRATAMAGVVSYDEETRSFSLADGGQYLRTDHPVSLNAFFQFLHLPCRQLSGVKFEETAKTGTGCMILATGGDFFEHCTTHPEDRLIFDTAMSQAVAGSMHDLMASSVPLDGIKTIMDVGGGQGKLVHRLVSRTPGLKGICFDLESVVADSPYKDDNSITLVGGDFFKAETIPTGADAVVVATVLHDWDDESCVTILTNVRSVLPVGGKLFISEHIISNVPSSALILDIEMLWVVTGRERNEREFIDIAKKASFEFKTTHKSPQGRADVVEFVAV